MFASSNEILEAHEINNPCIYPSWPELVYVNKAFYGSTCHLGGKVLLSRLPSLDPSPWELAVGPLTYPQTRRRYLAADSTAPIL